MLIQTKIKTQVQIQAAIKQFKTMTSNPKLSKQIKVILCQVRISNYKH